MRNMSHGTWYFEEFMVRVVELLGEVRYNARSESQAVKTVASWLGIVQETLRRWSKSQDGLAVPSLSAWQAQDEVKRLCRKNRELKRANEIVQMASAFLRSLGSARTGVKNTGHRRVRVTVWYRVYLHSIICESSWWVYHCPRLLSSQEA